MTLLLLVACAHPPLVDAVEEQLAAEVLDRGQTPLRIFVALSSVAAEGCAVPDIETYTFVGGGARALGITAAEKTVLESGDIEWAFANAGLDDVGTGELSLKTTTDRASFDVTYTLETAGITVTGTIPVLLCDVEDADPTEEGIALQGDSATGGTLEFTEDAIGTKVLAEGDKPFEGLHFNPPTDTIPWAGWAKWSDDSDDAARGQALELDGASLIDGDEWPGVASGIASNDIEWDRIVSVKLP